MLQTAKQSVRSSLLPLSKNYACYNEWANKELTTWLRTKQAELLDQQVPSSFSSLKETLFHIGQTQKWWLEVLQQLPTEDALWGLRFDGTSEEVFRYLSKQSDAFALYVQSLTESDVQQECSFTIPSVGTFTLQRFEIIQHCINHSTYHRGQLITIGRNVGLTDPPMTDYMFYLLMVN